MDPVVEKLKDAIEEELKGHSYSRTVDCWLALYTSHGGSCSAQSRRDLQRVDDACSGHQGVTPLERTGSLCPRSS